MRIEGLHSSLAYFPDLDGWWRPDNLQWTEEKIRSLLTEQPADTPSVRSIVLHAQLARVRALQGEVADARSWLEKASAMVAGLDVDATTELRYLLEYGRVLALAMSPQKAAPVFLQAWNLATQSRQDFFAIDAAVMLSTILPLKSQNVWLQQALKLVQESECPEAKLWLGQLHFMTGWHAFDLHQYEEAKSSFEAAMATIDSATPAAKLFPFLWSKARVLRALDRTEEALEMQKYLLDRMQALGKVNGHVYLEIAECNQMMRDLDQARIYFELAHTALAGDGWYADNRASELERMKYLFKKRT